jgi:hypothetical protein
MLTGHIVLMQDIHHINMSVSNALINSVRAFKIAVIANF